MSRIRDVMRDRYRSPSKLVDYILDTAKYVPPTPHDNLPECIRLARSAYRWASNHDVPPAHRNALRKFWVASIRLLNEVQHAQ